MSWTLVTGAAQGLGAAIARRVAISGHDVLIHYRRSREKAEAVAAVCVEQGVRVELVQGDFNVGTVGIPYEVDALINNVGAYLVKPSLETSMEEWHDLFESNFFGPLALIQQLRPTLKSVVNIGVAGLASMRADVKSPAYRLSKLALWGLTKCLARELAGEVRVNMVSPGQLENSEDLASGGVKLPLGRPSTLEEVADAVIWLLEANESITGQDVVVSGGYAS